MSNGHGGKREGAGRKAGAATRMNEEARAKAAEGGLMPLDYMLSVLRDEEQPAAARMDAAKAAAPYVHAKLASVEHSGKDGGPMVLEIVRFADSST
ncbi:hypothetical protein CO670_15465 [Rhizobium sp. J15]|uniref:hypothetical protein n=1 Tax=Rhizobium sp. J15 TaxID=2035450 RepID=UPI000BE9E674|nr:hypothetical protein [Rhizobium sp. J15]PDT15892.1 hypothetical protein CO670_15465 [Rhizobium sp. J15]